MNIILHIPDFSLLAVPVSLDSGLDFSETSVSLPMGTFGMDAVGTITVGISFFPFL